MQKNSYPKISIVTPSYNQGQFIEYNIKSVINQRYPNYEHIIIDNCSTDQTINILKKYPHLKWVSEKDKGQSDALNKALEMATGEIIGWQNADDYYLPKSFHVAVDHLKKNWNSEIVYGDYLLVDVNGRLIQHRKEINFYNFIFEYLHFCYIPSTSTFFRRIIIEEGNYFDVNFHFAMDFEYFLRLHKKNYHFSHINKFISAFRLHDSGKSFVQAEKQKIEHRNALLLHNKQLKKMQPLFRFNIIYFFQLLARIKRVFNKGLKGFYFQQWRLIKKQ
jgi:glycosyltransferase involved in cell wall biosynthesis